MRAGTGQPACLNQHKSETLSQIGKVFLSKFRNLVIILKHARVAKLVDAPDLGSGGSSVGVRVPSRAPDKHL